MRGERQQHVKLIRTVKLMDINLIVIGTFFLNVQRHFKISTFKTKLIIFLPQHIYYLFHLMKASISQGPN